MSWPAPCDCVGACPTPWRLWADAEGDRDVYLRAMKVHGHLVPAQHPDGVDRLDCEAGQDPGHTT